MEQQARAEARTTSEGSCGSEVTLQLLGSTAVAPVGAWSRVLDPQCGPLAVGTADNAVGRLCNCTPVRFALESRVSKNTLGITPYHGPSRATILSVHTEMRRACCFSKCGVGPIAMTSSLSYWLLVLALASVPDLFHHRFGGAMGMGVCHMKTEERMHCMKACRKAKKWLMEVCGDHSSSNKKEKALPSCLNNFLL